MLLAGDGKKIKPENLKTPGGIMRTNAFNFNSGNCEVLLEQICRINHSCEPNVMKQRLRRGGEFGDFVLTAICPIRKGEQLFIDYGVPDGDLAVLFIAVRTSTLWISYHPY